MGKGWGFDGEIHLLSGRFDRVPLLGGRDILICSAERLGHDRHDVVDLTSCCQIREIG